MVKNGELSTCHWKLMHNWFQDSCRCLNGSHLHLVSGWCDSYCHSIFTRLYCILFHLLHLPVNTEKLGVVLKKMKRKTVHVFFFKKLCLKVDGEVGNGPYLIVVVDGEMRVQGFDLVHVEDEPGCLVDVG